jgi:hypothetical protein
MSDILFLPDFARLRPCGIVDHLVVSKIHLSILVLDMKVCSFGILYHQSELLLLQSNVFSTASYRSPLRFHWAFCQ